MHQDPNSGSSHASNSSEPSRRRYSVWTLLAPAAVAVLWIVFFSSLSGSCLVKGCSKAKDTSSETATTKLDANIAKARKVKILKGTTLGQIAQTYGLTEDELKSCNPNLDPQALTLNAYINVAQDECKGADLAEAGANPDPLAGETNAATGSVSDAEAAKADTTNNGTAAADPSVDAAQAKDSAATAEAAN